MTTHNKPDPHGASMDPKYPFGILLSVFRTLVGVTVATYLLFVSATFLGGWAAGTEWFDSGFRMLVVFVIPYILLAGAENITVPIAALMVAALWYCAVYSESTKLRLILLATIFAISFASAWYAGS